MHHHHAALDAAASVNLVTNLAIVAGYIVVPFTALRWFPLTWPVRLAGTGFFLSCATTHLSMAFGWDHLAAWMLLVHSAQAICVWVFVIGLAGLIRAARSRQDGG